MARRRAEPVPQTRIAVVGATSASGLAIRGALERAGVPGSRVGLFGSAEDEATLAEYDGEARLIQGLRDDELDVYPARIACDRRTSERIAALDSASGLLVSTWETGRRDAPTVGAARRSGGALPREVRLVHPLALAVVRLASGIAAGPGIASWTSVVFRPAADRGEVGIEELRAQTVALLSFASPPTEVLGRRLAFDCVPQAGMPGEPAGLEVEIASDVQGELGSRAADVAVRLVWVSAFYGHAVLTRCATRQPIEPAAMADLLTGSGIDVVGSANDVPSLAETTEETTLRAAVLGADGPSSCWLWSVIDGAQIAAADEAIALIRDSGTL